eukprot:jgi/Galph1/3023/GphlegSOOS_G1661.1
MSTATADVGLIGLAVMGQNLVLNMNDHGFKVAVFNRTVSKVDDFLNGEAKNTNIVGAHSIQEFCALLKKPRIVILLVKAGEAVDQFISLLLPYLESGDLIVDGGIPTFWILGEERKSWKQKEGARHGPSIMPGGSSAAWKLVKPIFQAISAKADNEPCCEWVGEDGAGHYVKMVHNGIEYGDMELICEAYNLMRRGLHMQNAEIAQVFSEWNTGVLNCYLIEITANILKFKDKDGSYLVDKILDTAEQKGTGKWTAMSSLDLNVPVTLIAEAVFCRILSSMKDERVQASKVFGTGQVTTFTGDKQEFIKNIHDALYASKIVSYTQGYMLLREAAKYYGWNLNYGGIALMWRGGCIIRSIFLGKIRDAFLKNPSLSNLLLDDFFKYAITKAEKGWRNVVSQAALMGIPCSAFSTGLAFFDSYRSEQLPANLLQAQRDYFGAHTYERIDQPRGKYFHTNWTGSGGNVTSNAYKL